MLYPHFTATAAVLLLLGGNSFLDIWDALEMPVEVSSILGHDAGGQPETIEVAAPSGFQPDREVTLGGSLWVTADTGAATGEANQVQPIKPELNIKDLLLQPQAIHVPPIAAAIESESYSLADLIADWDWRRQTSEFLNLLFK